MGKLNSKPANLLAVTDPSRYLYWVLNQIYSLMEYMTDGIDPAYQSIFHRLDNIIISTATG